MRIENHRFMRILIKYGGNAMRDPAIQADLVHVMASASQIHDIVIVHGGGPAIGELLDRFGMTSSFVNGHRSTPPDQLPVIEMALRSVNGKLVELFSRSGASKPPVGLSGKDAGLITATLRIDPDGDLGLVGDVAAVDPALIELLLQQSYLPIVACLAAEHDGTTVNVNADMLAGALAGALKVDRYLVLTDVDGLRRDPQNPDSMIPEISLADIAALGNAVSGGMIPKLEGCRQALESGAGEAIILNGTKPPALASWLEQGHGLGTRLVAKEAESNPSTA